MESQLGTLSGLEGRSQLPLFCNEEMAVVGEGKPVSLPEQDRANPVVTGSVGRDRGGSSKPGLLIPLKLLQLTSGGCKKISKPKQT